MRIEAAQNGLPPNEGAADPAFVILGRSTRKAACADPRIHAVTFAEEPKRFRMSAKKGTAACSFFGSGPLFHTVAGRGGNGMDPRVCAASLRSLLRPRMTKV
jgi:hypothetical protein